MTIFKERVIERVSWELDRLTEEERITLAYALVPNFNRETDDAGDCLLCEADIFEVAYALQIDLGDIQDEIEREYDDYVAGMEALRNEYLRSVI